MEATAKLFSKWALELERRVFDSRGKKDSVRAVAAQCCAVWNINDPWYLKGGRERTESGQIEMRKPNVQFRASRTVPRAGFRMRELVQIAALKNIKVGEKLFVDCAEKLMFYKVKNRHFFEKSRMKFEKSEYIAD